MPKLHVYNGKSWEEIGKNGKDATIKDFLTAIEEGKLELKTKHIKDYKDPTDIVRRHLAGVMRGGQGSWKQKQLVGAINGINKVFTFGGEPPAQYSERVFLNYIEQNPFTDYTILGNTITYTVAPDASLSTFPHIIRFM